MAVHQSFTDFKRAYDSVRGVFLCSNFDGFLILLKLARLKTIVKMKPVVGSV